MMFWNRTKILKHKLIAQKTGKFHGVAFAGNFFCSGEFFFRFRKIMNKAMSITMSSTYCGAASSQRFSSKHHYVTNILFDIFFRIGVSLFFKPWKYIKGKTQTDNYYNEEGDYIVRTKYEGWGSDHH